MTFLSTCLQLKEIGEKYDRMEKDITSSFQKNRDQLDEYIHYLINNNQVPLQQHLGDMSQTLLSRDHVSFDISHTWTCLLEVSYATSYIDLTHLE